MPDDGTAPILPKPGRRRRTRLLRRLGLGVVFLATLAAAGAWAWDHSLSPVDPTATGTVIPFSVPKGASAQRIAEDLEAGKLIRNRAAWLLAASRSGFTQRFQAGDYVLSPSWNGQRIMEELTHGTVAAVTVTIPEGRTLEQIARDVAAKTGLCTAEQFIEAASDPSRWPSVAFPLPAKSLEGYLFPDTYEVDRGSHADQIVAQMLKRFESEWERFHPDLEASGMSLQKTITLASIIEKEVSDPSERPIAAQVFLLRLKRGMKLESCATVQYLLKEPKPVLSYADTRIDSPYNTYRNAGLPPGPICSPGAACIAAALHPAKTDYLFFRTRGNGPTHVFSRTYEEHMAAGKGG